jgi:hypothetical protein
MHMARTTFGINRRPSHLCLIVQDCGHRRHFCCDETRRCGLEARRLARVPSKNMQSLMLAPKVFGARARRRRVSSCPTARLQRQEYRLRLKRLPPIRPGGWFPPFKSSTPEGLRGSCAYAFLSPWSNGNSRFRFGNKNCALLILSLQNGIQQIPGREGENEGPMAQSRGPRDDGHSNNQLINPYYYEHQSHHHQR